MRSLYKQLKTNLTFECQKVNIKQIYSCKSTTSGILAFYKTNNKKMEENTIGENLKKGKTKIVENKNR